MSLLLLLVVVVVFPILSAHRAISARTPISRPNCWFDGPDGGRGLMMFLGVCHLLTSDVRARQNGGVEYGMCSVRINQPRLPIFDIMTENSYICLILAYCARYGLCAPDRIMNPECAQGIEDNTVLYRSTKKG